MEKRYYVVVFKPEYLALLRSISPQDAAAESSLDEVAQKVVVCLTQGGFGQDVIDDELQVKERFLEYLFSAEDVDLPRTPEVFDQYFTVARVDEFIDLDEEF
jgi:hypothetical protein